VNCAIVCWPSGAAKLIQPADHDHNGRKVRWPLSACGQGLLAAQGWRLLVLALAMAGILALGLLALGVGLLVAVPVVACFQAVALPHCVNLGVPLWRRALSAEHIGRHSIGFTGPPPGTPFWKTRNPARAAWKRRLLVQFGWDSMKLRIRPQQGFGVHPPRMLTTVGRGPRSAVGRAGGGPSPQQPG